MLKKTGQQGRRPIETGGVPLGYVEGLNDARTPLGKRRVSARRGRAGEKSGFFQHPDTSLVERIALCGNLSPLLF